MGEAPTLEIMEYRRSGYTDPTAQVVENDVAVDGQPLTEEEREIAAVAVACYRRGWEIIVRHSTHGDEVSYAVRGSGLNSVGFTGATPSEAYARAVESEDPHTTGGD